MSQHYFTCSYSVLTLVLLYRTAQGWKSLQAEYRPYSKKYVVRTILTSYSRYVRVTMAVGCCVVDHVVCYASASATVFTLDIDRIGSGERDKEFSPTPASILCIYLFPPDLLFIFGSLHHGVQLRQYQQASTILGISKGSHIERSQHAQEEARAAAERGEPKNQTISITLLHQLRGRVGYTLPTTVLLVTYLLLLQRACATLGCSTNAMRTPTDLRGRYARTLSTLLLRIFRHDVLPFLLEYTVDPARSTLAHSHPAAPLHSGRLVLVSLR